MPMWGDRLLFKSPVHAIYDGFPTGNKVTPEEVFVAFTERIVVHDSRRHTIIRWHWGKKKEVKCDYVAVQFKAENGSLYWTNYSRDGETWLWTEAEILDWMVLHPDWDPEWDSDAHF